MQYRIFIFTSKLNYIIFFRKKQSYNCLIEVVDLMRTLRKTYYLFKFFNIVRNDEPCAYLILTVELYDPLPVSMHLLLDEMLFLDS